MEKYLWAAVLFVIFLGHCSYSCPDGTYGYNCGYTCNCDHDNCDPTSGCSPQNCSSGWSGPTCQKHNVARAKTTSSSGDIYPSSRATDGNTAANWYAVCIETKGSNPNWWRVDLNDTVLIRDVTIYFRLYYTHRRNGIQVYLTNTTNTAPPSGVLCYTVTGSRFGTDINDTISAPCHGRGRYVLLYTTITNEWEAIPKMDFCEVEVNACDPGTFGADCENYCHCKDGVCNDTTGACPPGGCLADWKGTNCDVECDDNVEYGPYCRGACSARMCQGDVSTCPRDTGRCTDGCQAGWKGEDCTTECVQGTEYGVGCNKTCITRMCQGDGSTCPRDTGRCDGGCQAGWRGVDCRQECTVNVNYGPGCHGNCRSRKCKEVSGSCPPDTGRCDGGCQPGWEGVDCMLECASRTFGVNCSSTCGHCVDDEPCHHVTGTCLKGCSPGWVNDTCQQECQSRTFGVNCSSTCGHCVDDEPCHHVTGTCLKGCSPGWVNDTCQQVVNSLPGNSTGRISPLAVGLIGAVAMLVLLAVVAGAVCSRRKGDFGMAKTSSKEPGTPQTSTAPPVEVPTYDVLPTVN